MGLSNRQNFKKSWKKGVNPLWNGFPGMWWWPRQPPEGSNLGAVATIPLAEKECLILPFTAGKYDEWRGGERKVAQCQRCFP